MNLYEQLAVGEICRSILNFFSKVDKRYPGRKLPGPSGLLSRQVPASAISSANHQVSNVLSHSPRGSRGAYQEVSAEKKAEIGKRAAECGVAATFRFYALILLEPLKESSVRDWRNAFLKEKKRLRRRKRCHES